MSVVIDFGLLPPEGGRRTLCMAHWLQQGKGARHGDQDAALNVL